MDGVGVGDSGGGGIIVATLLLFLLYVAAAKAKSCTRNDPKVAPPLAKMRLALDGLGIGKGAIRSQG